MSADLYPVTVIAFPGVLLMDIAGPMQVFGSANQMMPSPHYDLRIASEKGAPVQTDVGVTLSADIDFGQSPPIGDIIIPGGPGLNQALQNEGLIDFIRLAAKNQRRIITVCSGSMLLAQAGLLNEKEATCHWVRTPFLFERFPKVLWKPDAIFTEDGNIFCSAGVTAGIDLSLVLLEKDKGRDLALEVARELVVYMRRSGGQSQYSRPLRAQAAMSSRIRSLCQAVTQDPTRDWTLSQMSADANMTERTLHRHFQQEFGESPSRFVQTIRLDHARSYLEHGGKNMGEVARLSGFKNEQTLRRIFTSHLHITPHEYRERFGRLGS